MMKGSATGTLSGMDQKPQPPTELEKLSAEGAQMARQLLASFTTAPNDINSNAEETFAPLQADVRATPNPTPLPVPSAPSGGDLLSGLLATNIAGAAAQNPMFAQAGLDTARSRITGREEIQRQNVVQQNAADAQRQLALLSLREKILSQKLQDQLANQQAAQADKTSKELFVVNTALEHVKTQLATKAAATMTREQLASQERVAKMEGLFGFLSRIPGMMDNGASGGMDPKNELDELTKLNDFTTQIDLKLQPDRGTFGFGKKVPSDEEMAAHFRVFNSYLSSPSARVRSAALYNMRGALEAKFGDDQKAKQAFLVKNGFVTE